MNWPSLLFVRPAVEEYSALYEFSRRKDCRPVRNDARIVKNRRVAVNARASARTKRDKGVDLFDE